MSADEGEIKVKSLKKAIDVLNCFIEVQSLGVTEISERLGLYKSNVHDILSTFQAMNYVTQSKSTGKYYLGPQILRLNNALSERYSFLKVASSAIHSISKETGEVVYLTSQVDRCVYYLDVACPANTRMPLFNLRSSTSDYLHCTSSGKTMLAFMSQEARETYLRQPLERMTEYSITDVDELRQQLEEIRVRGYAVDRNENTLGVSCVGAPVLAMDGCSIGAISISGPSSVFTEERVRELSELLKRHVKDIHIAV